MVLITGNSKSLACWVFFFQGQKQYIFFPKDFFLGHCRPPLGCSSLGFPETTIVSLYSQLCKEQLILTKLMGLHDLGQVT